MCIHGSVKDARTVVVSLLNFLWSISAVHCSFQRASRELSWAVSDTEVGQCLLGKVCKAAAAQLECATIVANLTECFLLRCLVGQSKRK